MAKLKNPFLSLSAHGTLGKTITAQRRRGTNFVRGMPTPTDPYSLLQAYQRWLYQDYLSLWYTLSDAEKWAWHEQATRYQRPAFAHYMSSQLTTLPKHIGIWHLDETSGAIAHDYAVNKINATIFGAAPVDGTIDHARYFDGVDDHIDIPYHGSLNPDSMTLEFFITFHTYVGSYDTPISRDKWSNRQFSLFRSGANLTCIFNEGSPHQCWVSVTLPPIGTPHHLCFTYHKDGTARAYDNGDFKNQMIGAGGNLNPSIHPLIIGRWSYNNTRPANVTIDHLVLFNTVIPDTLIKQHAERRYPP